MASIIQVPALSELNISYGFTPCEVAQYCLVAWTDDNICFLAFTGEHNKSAAFAELKKCWKNATFREDEMRAREINAEIFSLGAKSLSCLPYNLLVHGSKFQIKVWETLITINYGTTVSYEAVGCLVGGKNYTRAAASAIAKNNISYLIPCHRAVGKSGNKHKYQWGGDVKERLISWEKETITHSHNA